MQTKYLLCSIALTSAVMLGCSDDPATAAALDQGSLALPDTSTLLPYVDPATGETFYIPPSEVSSAALAGYSAASIPVSSGTAVPQSAGSVGGNSSGMFGGNSSGMWGGNSAGMFGGSSGGKTTLSSSSTVVGVSSSGLKEYDDNHKAKETFLPKAGFYKSLTVDPPTPRQGGQIKCTTDGSYPNQGSQQLTQAMQITKNTVIRCSEFVNGQAVDTTTQTYFINENVSMPVVAITVNHHDMFDSTDGLYATGPLNGGMGGGMGMGGFGGGNVTDNNNPNCTEPCEQANYWSDKELPAHVEFFENGSSTTEKTWEIDAGISIIGNWSRYKPKKSVAIKMDNDNYGDKVLKYSMFKTRPEAKKIKSFNLRNNGNRFWCDYIGDAMMTALMEGTDVDYQRSRQVVVFYNGEYFGIHDLRERLNRSFVETNYGIDSKSINMVKIKGTQLEASGTQGASVAEYQQLYNEINSGNFAGENNSSYAQIKQKMNVSSFAQYMLAEMYFHNGDWPTNNVRAWGGNGNPFKFVAFDTDHGFGFTPGISGFDPQTTNMFQWTLGSATMNQGGQQDGGQSQWGGGMGGGMGMGMGMGMGGGGPGPMLSKLLQNPDFKRLFINQGCILLNDFLTYERVQKTVQEMMATIPSSEQQRDVQRWPRNQSNFTWDPSGSKLVQYAQNRSQTVRSEMSQYFGLSGEANVSISVSGNGSVLVEGMRLPKMPYQGKFFSGMEMELTAVPTNGGVFDGWSDGSMENPHKIQVNGSANITAKFK